MKGVVGALLRIIRPLNKEEISRIMMRKQELIYLLQNTPAISNFFDNTDLQNLILEENDSRGLERLRIIFSYMKCAVKWHTIASNGILTDLPSAKASI